MNVMLVLIGAVYKLNSEIKNALKVRFFIGYLAPRVCEINITLFIKATEK